MSQFMGFLVRGQTWVIDDAVFYATA